MLPIFSKIFEKIILNPLCIYFDHFILVSNSQFGFCKKASTSHVIVDTLQYLYYNLDEGKLFFFNGF